MERSLETDLCKIIRARKHKISVINPWLICLWGRGGVEIYIYFPFLPKKKQISNTFQIVRSLGAQLQNSPKFATISLLLSNEYILCL